MIFDIILLKDFYQQFFIFAKIAEHKITAKNE